MLCHKIKVNEPNKARMMNMMHYATASSFDGTGPFCTNLSYALRHVRE